MGGERRTAGLLIIGDEILSAKVEDVNTRFLCAELRSIGWTVEKVRWLVAKCGGGCCGGMGAVAVGDVRAAEGAVGVVAGHAPAGAG